MKCQCGANVTENFCPYCGADNRTNFQRNADTAMQISGKVMGHAKTAAKTMFIVWAIVAAFMIIGFVVAVIVISNNFPKMEIGLAKFVARIIKYSINFCHV